MVAVAFFRETKTKEVSKHGSRFNAFRRCDRVRHSLRGNDIHGSHFDNCSGHFWRRSHWRRHNGQSRHTSVVGVGINPHRGPL